MNRTQTFQPVFIAMYSSQYWNGNVQGWHSALIYQRFLGHSSLETVSIYAHADSEAMETALRSVDQDALPIKDTSGKVIAMPEKKWKGKEEYLLQYCGLG